MNTKIASAPDSWGVWFPSDPQQIPWSRFLDEIVLAGYEWTELGPYGYLPTRVPELQKELRQRGLKVCGSFAMDPLDDPAAWPGLEKQVLGTGKLLAALEARFLVLIDGLYSDPMTGTKLRPAALTADQWKKLIETTHRIATLAKKEFGLTTVFHPHAETHIEYEEQIERLLADTDPRLVSLCLDTGHHVYRGGDPIAFMRKHHRRVAYLHLKNVDRAVLEKVRAQATPFAPATAMGVFCPPAEGVVDFVVFRDVLHEVGYDGFAVIEQDMYPAPFDKPLPIARKTRAYLRSIGLG